MPQLVIFGNTQAAVLAHYYFSSDSDYEVSAFAVDEQFITTSTLEGLPVLPVHETFKKYPPESYHFFVALGYSKMNKLREETCLRIKKAGYQLASYVSSRCTWLSQKPPGENCLILEDNTIQPFAEVGNNITLWSGNHIGHHSVIEDHCFISSHVVVSGNVTIGHHSFLGVNSSIADGLRIAPFTLLGAGVTMTKDSIEHGVYVPQKAVLLNQKSDHFI